MMSGLGRKTIWLGMILATLTAWMAEARGQEETQRSTWLARLDAKYPQVPEEVLSSYVSLVRASPLFEVADALRAEKLEPEIRTWSKDSPFLYRLDVRPFLDLARQGRYKADDGTRFKLMRAEFESELGPTVDLVVLYVEPKDPPAGYLERMKKEGQFVFADDDDVIRPYAKQYRVRGDSLEDLRFDVVTTLNVRHPVLRKLDLHSVQDMPLADVVQDLCQLAGFDYAYKFDDANNVSVTMELKDVTVRACLEAAAGVAGFKVLYGEATNPVFERGVRLSEVRREFVSRKYLGWADPNAAADETPADILRRLVLEKAEGLLKWRRVITLRPASVGR